MLKRNLLTTFMIVSMLLSISTAAYGNLARIIGLGLENQESDWMLPDSEMIFSNPVYILQYNNFVDLTTNASGGNPRGSVIMRLSPKMALGLTLGYSYDSVLNPFAIGNPVGDSDFNNATFIISAPPFDVNPIGEIPLVHFGYDFTRFKLGCSLGYDSHNETKDYDFSDPANTNNNLTVTDKASHQMYHLNTGIMLPTLGPLRNLSLDLGCNLPSLLRERSETPADTPGYQNVQQVTGEQALDWNAGFTGTLPTSVNNSLLWQLSYRTKNGSGKISDYYDENGNGSYLDPGDRKIDDSASLETSVLTVGLADQYQLNSHSFLFAGAYYRFVTEGMKISGARADGVINGPNYSNPFDMQIMVNSLPVIVGGEINVTNWLTARLSLRKSLIFIGKTSSTTKIYIPGTDTLVDETVTTANLQEDSGMNCSAGLAVTLGQFNIDWVLNQEWIGNGGPLSSEDYDSFSTRFSLTYRL